MWMTIVMMVIIMMMILMIAMKMRIWWKNSNDCFLKLKPVRQFDRDLGLIILSCLLNRHYIEPNATIIIVTTVTSLLSLPPPRHHHYCLHHSTIITPRCYHLHHHHITSTTIVIPQPPFLLFLLTITHNFKNWIVFYIVLYQITLLLHILFH